MALNTTSGARLTSDIISVVADGKASVVNSVLVSIISRPSASTVASYFRLYGFDQYGALVVLCGESISLRSDSMNTRILQCKSIPVVSVYWDITSLDYISEVQSVAISLSNIHELNFPITYSVYGSGTYSGGIYNRYDNLSLSTALEIATILIPSTSLEYS